MNLPAIAKPFRWLVVLVLLISIGIAQAQTLRRPTIKDVVDYSGSEPGRAFVIWETDPNASSYEVFVKGPRKWRLVKQGGWHPAPNGLDGYAIFWLMPGDTYTYRVRAIDAEGNKSKMSKKFRSTVAPCWVLKRFWHTGERPASRSYGEMPSEWAVENTPTCEEYRPETGRFALPKE